MKLLLAMIGVGLAIAAEGPEEVRRKCAEELWQLSRNEWGYPRGLAGSEPPRREEPPLDIESLEEFYRRLGGEDYGETDRLGKDAAGEGSGGEADHSEGL